MSDGDIKIAVLEEKVTALIEDVDGLKKQVSDLTLALTKYKGFVGGVVFLGSSLVTCLGLVIAYFVGK